MDKYQKCVIELENQAESLFPSNLVRTFVSPDYEPMPLIVFTFCIPDDGHELQVQISWDWWENNQWEVGVDRDGWSVSKYFPHPEGDDWFTFQALVITAIRCAMAELFTGLTA